MSSDKTVNSKPATRRLTPWELPKLLAPIRSHKSATRPKKPKERPHYSGILAFVYRNRMCLASQVQRRFSHVIQSDRTARRQLVELEALGWLNSIPIRGCGQVFPKVFSLAPRGATRLREVLKDRGLSGEVIRLDRRRAAGNGSEFVIHELLTTEFLLAWWQTVNSRGDLTTLQVERRSLKSNPAFVTSIGQRRTQLIPDAMIAYRQDRRGMMVCFLELDMGTMSIEQIKHKYARYESWVKSSCGKRFLQDLYRRHGAANPRPTFRLLMVVGPGVDGKPGKRVEHLIAATESAPLVRKRTWFTTTERLRQRQSHTDPLSGELWRCAGATRLAELI